MSENFFDFNTDFPPKNVLGRNGLEEELLTADVEDEYDALNDETFGRAANDDWEEAHEKLSELVVPKPVGKNSAFDDSLLEGDESQDDIVSKSISQLGLEDDLDDPAIMTISRNCHALGHLRSFRSSSSPPPPAILETEICGSPKTHSIWSTTPKDSGISSFLQSLNHNSGLSRHDSHNSVSDNVFVTPPKAWRAEELERDLLSSSNKDPPSSWPQVPQHFSAEHHNSSHLSSTPRFPGSKMEQNQNSTPKDRMLTQEEVERRMHSEPRMVFPRPANNYYPRPMIPPPPGLQPNILSPLGKAMINNLNSPNQSSPIVPIRPNMARFPVPGNYFVNARMNLMHNQMPPLNRPAIPNHPPGYLNSINMNLKHNIPIPPRSIAHPLLNKQIFPMVIYNNHFDNEEYRNSMHSMEDEYDGLMTQREKEWLIRIQLLQLKSENPYVEDYYFTTQVARRCQKKYSESAKKDSREAPELILPETTKHENKAFVPTQFEGSLGKLQAVSVNFPRKVLDWTEKKPVEEEEDNKTVCNQSLMRFRQLLLDIERLYAYILEIEDEERRILAKPESECGQHRANIAKMTKDIFNGLVSKGSDYFQTLMTIHKGRTFVIRAFKIFSAEEKIECLVHLLGTLSLNLKRVQNDHILVQHIKMFTDVVSSLSLAQLTQLSSEAFTSPDTVKAKDGSNLHSALKSKFGSSIVCSMLLRAEALYADLDLSESNNQPTWTKFILQVAECLCSIESSSIVPPEAPFTNLLSHFQRFSVDMTMFEQLSEKLTILHTGSKATG